MTLGTDTLKNEANDDAGLDAGPKRPEFRGPVLNRVTLTTSRLLDFASRKELTAQTGHVPDDWPIVVLKELIDNSIDACEEAGIAPTIVVTVDASGIAVADNGPGLPIETIKDVLDYTVRVSSREAYVSPTRGAQGNALKTILAMPFALDRNSGQVEIETGGTKHVITFRVDRIAQKPVIDHAQVASDVKTGTIVRVAWPSSASSILDNARVPFLQMADAFVWLNPHLTIRVNWDGAEGVGATANEPGWRKWRPSDPTSPHWYRQADLARLIAGYLTHDRATGGDRTVRDFVAEFRGLSGTAKQKAVTDAANLSRARLSDLVRDDDVNHEAVEALLTAMREWSKPIKPEMLGIIGKDHWQAKFRDLGCEMESFEYRQVKIADDQGVPWLAEVAFGYCPEETSERRLVTGVNWSPGIVNPFRTLRRFDSLDNVLTRQRVERKDPVILVLHFVCPRVEYTDRGKSAIVLTDTAGEMIIDAIEGVTKKWAKQRKAEERSHSAILNRRAAMTRRRTVSIKAAAWDVMEAAYLKASANGTLPANARQIMYAARPYIQRTASKKLSNKFDQYFTQTLLPDYIEKKGVDWDVVFDARGRLTEPHTGSEVPLGTLQVREYLDEIGRHKVGDLSFSICEALHPTRGPGHRFGAILFIEKEGFTPLFQKVRLAERYDIAIMSTKGMSVTASRELVQAMSDLYDVPVLVVHDFDVSGFTIYGTLSKSTRRHKYKNRVKVINLGLGLADIDGLESETVAIKSVIKTRNTLYRHGATDEEIEFLAPVKPGQTARRVELNAMPSDQFVAWIDRKLDEHGVTKIVPDDEALSVAYRRMRRQAAVQAEIDALLDSLHDDADDMIVPGDLRARLQDALERNRTLSWDMALRHIVQ